MLMRAKRTPSATKDTNSVRTLPLTLWIVMTIIPGPVALAADAPFRPVTQDHVAETIRIRYEALRGEFRRAKPEGNDRYPGLAAVTCVHAAMCAKLSGDAEAVQVVEETMDRALSALWSGTCIIDSHNYLANAIWASLVGAALLEAGDAVNEKTRGALTQTVLGAAEVCRNRATAYAPTNVFVSNQDAWAASALLRAFQCFGEEAFKDAARSKFLAILERQQQGFWSENGVGPLYQGVGLSPFSEVADAFFDELTWEQRQAAMEVSMAPCLIHTGVAGAYKLGLEAARSSGFRPSSAISWCLDLALRQRNPFLLHGAINQYYGGLRNVEWQWGLCDPVPAHFLLRFYKLGQLAAGEADTWRFAWGAKARIAALKEDAVCDEQTYLRSGTGLVAHFADRRLAAGVPRDVQFDPGGLRTIARAHEVIGAPDALSRPRPSIPGEAPRETEYVWSLVRRGVYASQYEVLQGVRDEADGPAGWINQTFCAVGDWLVVRMRSRGRATLYSLTHPDSDDGIVASGRAIVSRFKQSASGKEPETHAIFSLDGMELGAAHSDLRAFPGIAVKMPLDEWRVPFEGTQLRYFAVQAHATAEAVTSLLAAIRPAESIDGQRPDLRGAANATYGVSLPTETGTYYFVFANTFRGEATTVSFGDHEFRLLDMDRCAISVFEFDRTDRLVGFAASARQLFVDDKEVFRAPGTAYVSAIVPGERPGYASADCGTAELCISLQPCRSLATGEQLDAPRLRRGEIVTCTP